MLVLTFKPGRAVLGCHKNQKADQKSDQKRRLNGWLFTFGFSIEDYASRS